MINIELHDDRRTTKASAPTVEKAARLCAMRWYRTHGPGILPTRVVWDGRAIELHGQGLFLALGIIRARTTAPLPPVEPPAKGAPDAPPVYRVDLVHESGGGVYGTGPTADAAVERALEEWRTVWGGRPAYVRASVDGAAFIGLAARIPCPSTDAALRRLVAESAR